MKPGHSKNLKAVFHSSIVSDRSRRLLSIGLYVVAITFGILTLVRVAGFFVVSARAESLVKMALSQNKDANDVEEYLAKDKTAAEKLKERNLFAPPQKKQHPVKEVSGILGNEVLISGKWYKVGDKVGDANIVAIEPTFVRIEWQGSEKNFAPISSVGAPVTKDKKVESVAKKESENKGKDAPVEKPVETKAEAAPTEDDPLAWMGVKLSPALREKILEKWNEMSDEEKEKHKEQWNQLPDEQKQAIVDQMEENIDQL